MYFLGTETSLHYPKQFLHHLGRDQVAATLAREFPNLALDQLRMEPDKGRLMYPTPALDQQDPLHPPYLAVRFHDVLKPTAQTALINAWNALNSLNVEYPRPEPQRSKAPALHLGVWETYLMSPSVTANSRNQPPEVITAMDIFLSLIGGRIAPKLLNFLGRYFPRQYERQQRCIKISINNKNH
jgi:hypothetical protein